MPWSRHPSAEIADPRPVRRRRRRRRSLRAGERRVDVQGVSSARRSKLTMHPGGQLSKVIRVVQKWTRPKPDKRPQPPACCRSVELREVELRRSVDRLSPLPANGAGPSCRSASSSSFHPTAERPIAAKARADQVLTSRHGDLLPPPSHRLPTHKPKAAQPSSSFPKVVRPRVGRDHQRLRPEGQRHDGLMQSLDRGLGDESVGKPDSVTHRERRGAIIHLRLLLPAAWCDLPGDSGEQPSGASADARTRPLDLAPGGVYQATPVAWGAGGLLHHRFTLTSEEAVCSLWHCPAGHPGWALPTTVLCGVRTFLTHLEGGPRSPDRLVQIQASACPSIGETRRNLDRQVLDADRRI